jgi:hypothetical protein
MSDSSNNMGPADSERRQFFRIDDTVRLCIRPLTPEQLAQGVAELEGNGAGNFTVMSSLAAISAKMGASMRRIEARDPDLAAYLRALDHKLEILGRAFLSQESELVSQQAQPVNLSAGGVSLYAKESMPVGQALEIRMLLFPSFTGVLAYGEVVGCAPLADGDSDQYDYQLRVEFNHLREPDREALIRHVLQRQSDELRERRLQAEQQSSDEDR